MSRILIVEDEQIQRRKLRERLAERGHDVTEASSVAEATAAGDLDGFDLVITDLRLPDATGTNIIERAGQTPVVVITAYAEVRSAVEAMRLGAADYIPKTSNHDELLLVAERLLAERLQRRRVAALARDIGEVWPVGGMIGKCPAMQTVFDHIKRVAPTDQTVLITGESGTGKELVARAIHDRSRRRDAPMVAVNCGAMPEGLIMAELFGCERGAFPGATTRPGLFEAADGGTLFLDEIGELPIAVQACLLRVLEDNTVRRIGATKDRKGGNVDVRLIAATNRDLKQLAFRADLRFRLKFEIKLPPLRERDSDVEELACHLAAHAAQRLGKGDIELTKEALAAVLAYHWPGNVRELRNAIERGAILCDTGRLTPELLGIEEPAPEEASQADKTRDGNYRRVILDTQARLSETELARLLGVTRTGLWRIRQRLDIPRPPRRP